MKWADILYQLSEHIDRRKDYKIIMLLDPKLFVGTVELVTLDMNILSRVYSNAQHLQDLVRKNLAFGSTQWESNSDLMHGRPHLCAQR